MSWWVADALDNRGPFFLASWIVWVVFSICLHELGHGFAAIWQGDDTPVRLNRMTLDPLVHMGGMSLIIFAMIGFAWGLMPVNPHAFRHGNRGVAMVAFAGPLVNLILAFFATTAWALWIVFVDIDTGFSENVAVFLKLGGLLNVFLLLLNLLPVPPLDGASILGGVSRPAREFLAQPEIQQFAFFALVALLWFAKGSSLMFQASESAVTAYATFIVRLFQ